MQLEGTTVLVTGAKHALINVCALSLFGLVMLTQPTSAQSLLSVFEIAPSQKATLMEPIASVAELTDLRPTDRQFQALRSLVEGTVELEYSPSKEIAMRLQYIYWW